MSHFARIDGLSAFTLVTELSTSLGVETVTLSGYQATVQEVIVAEQDFIDAGFVGDPSSWIQCSYNSNFRNIYPGPGHIYESIRDMFYTPQPYPSWKLEKVAKKGLDDEDNIVTITHFYTWVPPVPRPTIVGVRYQWNEENLNWEAIT